MSMTPRENMMAIYEGKQPDYYGNFKFASNQIADPIRKRDTIPNDGLQHADSWGTVCIWPPEAPGKHPVITDENAVVKDVTKWKEQLVIPPLDNLDWSDAKAQADATDRSEKFVEYFCGQGLFERSHFLMGMENAFCAYLEEPEAMYEMLTAIADYKKRSIKEAAYYLKPDVIFYQDDWGSKQNVFLPPDLWRELIKPLQKEIADTIHECGMIYMHHADCICEPLVEDMIDIGIDIWQGVIPENDIVAIQERTKGRLAMIGGIDGPAIDSETTTEEDVAAEVKRCIDTYCPAGRFFPAPPASLLHKRNSDMLEVELVRYGKEWAQAHPVS